MSYEYKEVNEYKGLKRRDSSRSFTPLEPSEKSKGYKRLNPHSSSVDYTERSECAQNDKEGNGCTMTATGRRPNKVNAVIFAFHQRNDL
jgi:hypothetical protein